MGRKKGVLEPGKGAHNRMELLFLLHFLRFREEK